MGIENRSCPSPGYSDWWLQILVTHQEQLEDQDANNLLVLEGLSIFYSHTVGITFNLAHLLHNTILYYPLK